MPKDNEYYYLMAIKLIKHNVIKFKFWFCESKLISVIITIIIFFKNIKKCLLSFLLVVNLVNSVIVEL